MKKFIDFIRHGVWEHDGSGAGRGGWMIRPFRIAVYTIKGIGRHDIMIRTAALTFYTVFSLVPIAALIFGFMKGFGFDEKLWEWLYGSMPLDYYFIIDEFREFVERMLIKTKGGLIAGIGIVVLLWAVMRVFNSMEEAFNNIWEVKKSRSFARKMSDYIAVIFIAPILLISSNSLTMYLRDMLSVVAWEWVLDALFWLGALMLTWLLFAFIYWVMPNTKVKFKGAIIAGIMAGTAFLIFQTVYFYIQGRLNTYNAVYGVFAAVPLFLVWLKTSWTILLVGAELSFAYQNIERYEFERDSTHMNADGRRKVLLAAMVVVVRHFLGNGGAVSAEGVANELNLPVRIVRDVLFDLENANLIVAVKAGGDDRVNMYVPARDVHEITVSDVIEGVERMGNLHLDMGRLPEMAKVIELLDEMKHKAFGSEENVRLTELI